MPQTFAPDDEPQNLLGILALALGVSTVGKGLLLLPRLLDDMVCQLFGFTWPEKGELGSKPSSVRRLRVVRSEELGKRGPRAPGVGPGISTAAGSARPQHSHGPGVGPGGGTDPPSARPRDQQPRRRGAWATLSSEGTWCCGITPAQHAGSRGKPPHVHCERMRKQVCLFFRASADEGITFCLIIHPWPGSNWRPPACGADVVATRPQVL